VSELARWANPQQSLLPSKEERTHSKAVANLVRETRFAGLKVDAEAALTGRIMERAVDLDGYRRGLANGDPVLDAVLTRIEVNFVDKAARIQRHSAASSSTPTPTADRRHHQTHKRPDWTTRRLMRMGP